MTLTLEAVEQLADQLSEQDQQALLQRLGRKLHTLPPNNPTQTFETRDQSEYRARRLRLAEQLLAEVADVEDDSQGTSDSVEMLRRVREGRRE